MGTPWLQAVTGRLAAASLALPDPRARDRFVRLALGFLCGEAPKTVSSALEWEGAGGDWSADYRLASRTRWKPEDLFAGSLGEAAARSGALVHAAIDDTLLRKTGKTIPGTAWARDPLSPPFRHNLAWGQRFAQTVVHVQGHADGPFRAIPVDFAHCPPAPKAKRRASAEEKTAARELRKTRNLSVAGRDRAHGLRVRLDAVPGGKDKHLVVAADGSYANGTFLRDPPAGTTLVVRLRKDASLREALPPGLRRGNRKYGPHLPTPERILGDDTHPLHTADLDVGDHRVHLKYKAVQDVRWQAATGDQPCTLICVKPLGYRLRRGGKLLYRQPVYLLVAGAPLADRDALFALLLRWGVEVAFREEKTTLGVGQPQVRNPLAVARAPVIQVVAYAALLLASIEVFQDRRDESFPPLPPWRKTPPQRPSARELVNCLRDACKAAPRHPPTTATAA